MVYLNNILVHVCVLLILMWENCQGQNHINDTCVREDGTSGQCVRFGDCPSAIEMVHVKKGTPQRCGFVGKHPIVCCEVLSTYQQQRAVGDMSKHKCAELYQYLPVTTTEPPVQVTTQELPEDISIEELIKLEKAKEEAAKLAGKPVDNVHHAAVGGKDAIPAEFSHMAALGYGERDVITWGCGGSLISEKHVLTAAHCIHTPLGRVKYVRLGDLDLKLTTDKAKPQDFDVAQSILHPDYRAPSVYNDIAIVELSANAVIDEFVRPACLYTAAEIPDGIWSATGWGVTSFQGTPANHLQEVTLRQFTFESCRDAYNSSTKRRLANGIDSKTQVCAGEEFKDTCQGDSGGPLQIRNRDYARGYLVIGITSFGKACGIANGPSVYTRVSHYIEWIESIVWPLTK